MFEVAGATLLVMGCIGLWAAVIVGIGEWVHKLLGRDDSSRLSFDRFWTGLAAVVFGLQIWHLFLPVDWKAALVLAASGLFGLVVGWRWSIPGKGCVIGAILLAAWAANLALQMPWNYDSGIYHFQSVRWANEYAIVPGLGNLHGRLAFNQSYFLYVALLNLSPVFQKGHLVANSLLLAAVACQLLSRAIQRTAPKEVRLFSILVLAQVCKQATRESLSSPSPDYPIYILGTVVMLWLIEGIATARIGGRLGTWPWMASLLVTCTGLTFKLSFFAVGVAVMALLMLVTFKELNRVVARPLVIGTVAAMLFLGVWITRGVISSGYPFFPMSVAGFAVDWKMPRTAVNGVQELVYSWARNPGRSAPDEAGWLKAWIRDNAKSSKVNRPILMFVLSMAVLGSLHFLYRQRSVISRWLLAPLLPPVLWLVFWFFTAPDPRFALAAFNLLSAWAATLMLLQIFAIRQWPEKYLLWSTIVLAFVIGAPRILKNGRFVSSFGVSHFGDLPTPPLVEVAIQPGLVIHVPSTSDQAWNAPLPSAPIGNGSLELRGKTLQEGFRDRRAKADSD